MFDNRKAGNRRRGAVKRNKPASTMPVFRLRTLLMMSLLGLIVAAAWMLRTSVPDDVMAFEHVNINGDFVNLSPEDIAGSVRDNLDGDYFTLDLDAMRDALLQHPWVQEVSVRRRWPSGLDINVVEKVMIAYWGEQQLLSDRGEVFRPQVLPVDVRLPKLAGPEGLHGQVWQFYVDVSSRMLAFDLAISELVLDQRRSWRVKLDNGTRIALGRSHVQDRLGRLRRVLAMGDAIVLDDIAQIDMRYPNGFAVRPVKTDAEAT